MHTSPPPPPSPPLRAAIYSDFRTQDHMDMLWTTIWPFHKLWFSFTSHLHKPDRLKRLLTYVIPMAKYNLFGSTTRRCSADRRTTNIKKKKSAFFICIYENMEKHKTTYTPSLLTDSGCKPPLPLFVARVKWGERMSQSYDVNQNGMYGFAAMTLKATFFCICTTVIVEHVVKRGANFKWHFFS